MRKLTNKKSGFTLIEIIVVLIIIGILAAIALPALFSNIDKSKGAEAIASLSGYKATVEGCYQGHVGSEVASCVTAPAMTTGAQGNFYYELLSNSCAVGSVATQTGYCIKASAGAANNVTDYVSLTTSNANSSNPSILCTGHGKYAGVC